MLSLGFRSWKTLVQTALSNQIFPSTNRKIKQLSGHVTIYWSLVKYAFIYLHRDS